MNHKDRLQTGPTSKVDVRTPHVGISPVRAGAALARALALACGSLLLVAGGLPLVGCSAGHPVIAVAAPDADQQATGQIAVNIDELTTALVGKIVANIDQQTNALISNIDQSVKSYDAWALRIQAAAPWLWLGLIGVPLLTYLLPKAVWVATTKAAGKIGQRRS